MADNNELDVKTLTEQKDDNLKEINLLNMDSSIPTVFRGYKKTDVKEYISNILRMHAEEAKNLTEISEELRLKNVALKTDLDKTVEKYNELISKNEEPEKKFREEKVSLNNRIERLEKTIREKDISLSEIAELKENNKSLSAIIKDKEDIINSQIEKINELNDKNHALDLALSDTSVINDKEIREKNALIETITAENTALKEKNEALLLDMSDGEIAKLRTALKNANIEVERLTTIREKEESEIDRITNDKEEIVDQFDRLTQDFKNISSEKAKIQDELERARGHKTLLEDELKALYEKNISLTEALFDARLTRG